MDSKQILHQDAQFKGVSYCLTLSSLLIRAANDQCSVTGPRIENLLPKQMLLVLAFEIIAPLNMSLVLLKQFQQSLASANHQLKSQ